MHEVLREGVTCTSPQGHGKLASLLDGRRIAVDVSIYFTLANDFRSRKVNMGSIPDTAKRHIEGEWKRKAHSSAVEHLTALLRYGAHPILVRISKQAVYDSCPGGQCS